MLFVVSRVVETTSVSAIYLLSCGSVTDLLPVCAVVVVVVIVRGRDSLGDRQTRNRAQAACVNSSRGLGGSQLAARQVNQTDSV